MLTHLKIENYALIDNLEIDFSKGLSVITGETGAGKSIIVGALSLILGQRADTQVLFDNNRKCIVEGSFKLPPALINADNLEEFFFQNDLDFDNETILRREINQSGKSRAFINDTPVKLTMLKELGDKLVDIHSQLTTLTLNESDFQLEVLDNYSKNNTLLKEYKVHYNTLLKLKKELTSLIEQENKANADKDYFQFLFDELEKAELKENEQTVLESEIQLLNNSQLIKKSLFDALYLFNNSDNNLLSGLNQIISGIEKISPLFPVGSSLFANFNDISKRLESSKIEINDIANEIELIDTKINYDPLRIEKINERLDLIYYLEKKHNVKSDNELFSVQNELSDKLMNISSLDDKIKKLNAEIDMALNTLHNIADKLSLQRKKNIPKLEEEILKLLNELGMPDAQFKIDIKDVSDSIFSKDRILNEFNNTGKDKVLYLFNANKGGQLKDIAKVASGGELSRLMLSIKASVARTKLLPTLILDEIDVGISGDIAGKVGNIIQKMSADMQVIAITHQHQIAAKGNIHFMVYKETIDNNTRSAIKQLNDDDRVEEITKMITGSKSSKSATQTAKELLKPNRT